MKKIIITGISGQDGSYMVDYLLANTSHLIYGVTRRLSKPDYSNFQHNNSNPRFKILTADLSDSQSIDNIVREIQPDYFINFAAQSFVGSSWQIPEQTFDVDAVGVIRCLEAIRKHAPKCRFYNAGSSEEFGDVKYCPQDEKHPLSPRSPYGAAKASARHIVKVYRESYNLFAIQGYLFNHESPKRGEEFVTRKITLGISRILKAIKNKEPFSPIELGNLDAKRDWSHAFDFVDGVWKMLNQETPKEFVLSSNETHTVREFIDIAFKYANIDASWHGNGLSEELSVHNYLIEDHNLKSSVLVKINPQFFRPAEVDILLGDSTLARAELGWQPKYSFTDLVKEMVKSDIANECQNT
jgi:GDPmannose 4,6-dehydratase